MKSVIALIVGCFLSAGVWAEDGDFKYFWYRHAFFVEFTNQTVSLDVLLHSNIAGRWQMPNITQFNVLGYIDKDTDPSQLIKAPISNKTALIFTGQSLERVYYPKGNYSYLNDTLLAQFSLYDLLIVELNETEDRQLYFNISNDFTPMVIVIS
jgi:hypothetical protein